MPIIESLESSIGHVFNRMSGHFIYPAKTGFMCWHNNADAIGQRMYAVYAPEANESFFRYVDRSDPENLKVITSWDRKGWNFRLFFAPPDPEHYLWHCISAGQYPRVSYGFFFD